MLLYASEVWGLNRLSNIESVHLFACKRFLNVQLKTPNKFIYGETGRYPLFVISYVRCIRYWLKVLKMDTVMLPKQAYNMLLIMEQNGKQCWASQVKKTLFELGFGFVWDQQGVGNENWFLKFFKQRCIDIFQQEWFSSVSSSRMFQQYNTFKLSFEIEKYFYFDFRKVETVALN